MQKDLRTAGHTVYSLVVAVVDTVRRFVEVDIVRSVGVDSTRPVVVKDIVHARPES